MRTLDLITGWTVENNPQPWGWYHLLCLVLTVIITVVLCIFVARKHDAKKDRLVVGITGTILLLAELYKQIFYTKINGYYNVYDFPLQFCSIPMWVMALAGLIPECKFKDWLYKFLATAGLIAGISVMVFPSGVFATHYITILIHTMLWHGAMIIVGVYLLVAREYAKSIKKFISEMVPGVLVLYVVITFALLVNVIWHYAIETPLHEYFVNKGITYANTAVNYFYISPFGGNTLVVLGWFRDNTPYAVFLLMYYLAFTLGSILVWFITYGINMAIVGCNKLINKRKENNKIEESNNSNIK